MPWWVIELITNIVLVATTGLLTGSASIWNVITVSLRQSVQ